MAKGKKCPNCNLAMFAESEKDERAGRYVVYVCNKCNHKEKVFEDYADR